MKERAMTSSGLGHQRFKCRIFWRIGRPRVATLVILGIFGFFLAIAVAWFLGEGTVSHIFAQINAGQQHPPTWLEVPNFTNQYLLIPTGVLVLIALAVMKISPQPQVWSRAVVVGIVLAITVRYVAWRSLCTLNLSDALNGIFSIGLFLLEMLMLLASSIQLYLTLKIKDRRWEADQMAVAVKNGTFTPSVDILIPTYNEPSSILQRTIIGCQALDYANKRIYLLDDTRRPEIKKLAEKLGCEYLSRPDNLYAKAGNLNHAISKTNGQLVVIFDADFIPTKNFLSRTVGFFQDETIALVQTPQSFYNHDPIARNLGLENIVTPDEEVFYRHIELIKDGAGSVVCAGTSFVVRRSALEAVGGFVTDSICEDYFTGIRLSAEGYRLRYLDEKLSAGLAAENMAAYLTQRMRWAQGTLQAFFIDANPLTIPGLTFLQRLAHLEGLLTWFTSISRILFLLMPLAYSFLDIIPVRATVAELVYFLVPYYLVPIAVFSWLNRHSRSALFSDFYSLLLCFPLAITVIKTMLHPFGKGFKVTPKGLSRNYFYFNWNLAFPLIFLFLATAVSLCWSLRFFWLGDIGNEWVGTPKEGLLKGMSLGWIWSAYNLVMLAIALLVMLDAPKPEIYDSFALRRLVRLKVGDRAVWGITNLISEIGAEIALTQQPDFLVNREGGSVDLGEIDDSLVILEMVDEGFSCPVASIEFVKNEFSQSCFRNSDSDAFAEFPTVKISFATASLSQYRRLVEMLYCRPGQWKRYETPSEWRSLVLLFKIILSPVALFSKRKQVRAIPVSQV